MSEPLDTIRRLVRGEYYVFTNKARTEMDIDGIEQHEGEEAILRAADIKKRLKSRNPHTGEKEHLHVIESETSSHRLLYLKGKLVENRDPETGERYSQFVFVSAKLAE